VGIPSLPVTIFQDRWVEPEAVIEAAHDIITPAARGITHRHRLQCGTGLIIPVSIHNEQ